MNRRRAFGRALLLLSTALATSACASRPAAWPGWRGPDGDGLARLESGRPWPGQGPRRLWSRSLGSGFSSVTVAHGRLYTGAVNDAAEVLVALDSDTGATLWERPLGEIYGAGSHGAGPRATPAIADGRVFALGSFGDLWAFDAESGEPLWHLHLPTVLGGRRPGYGFAASPIVWRNRLLLAPGGAEGQSLAAVGVENGEILWQTGDDPPSYSTGVVGEIAGTTQAVFLTAENLLALDPATGKILWTEPWEDKFEVNSVTPILTGGSVFVSASSGGGRFLPRRHGRSWQVAELWRDGAMANQFSSAILWQDHLYGVSDGDLLCSDLTTGRELWRQEGFTAGSVLGLRDAGFLALSYYCQLVWVAVDPGGYRELARFKPFATGRCLTSPTVVGDRLILRNEREIAAWQLPH